MSEDRYTPPVTPVEIEHRMLKLMQSNATAYQMLRDAETEYARLKTPLGLARARARFEAKRKATEGEKWNEGDREAYVLQQTEQLQLEWDLAELKVKAAKSMVAQVSNEMELIRSLSASVRNSMNLGS